MKPSDATLIAQILDGDPGAFDMLYERYEGKIRARLIRIVREESVAQDLAQEVFLRVWARVEQWSGKGTFSAWLNRMATNLALNHLRSIKRRREHPLEIPKEVTNWDDEDGLQVPGWMIDTVTLGAEEMVVLKEQHEMIHYLLECLPEQQQEVIRLVVDAQMDIQSTADTLGIPEGTVKSRLYYAKKRLEKEWRDFENTEEGFE